MSMPTRAFGNSQSFPTMRRLTSLNQLVAQIDALVSELDPTTGNAELIAEGRAAWQVFVQRWNDAQDAGLDSSDLPYWEQLAPKVLEAMRSLGGSAAMTGAGVDFAATIFDAPRATEEVKAMLAWLKDVDQDIMRAYKVKRSQTGQVVYWAPPNQAAADLFQHWQTLLDNFKAWTDSDPTTWKGLSLTLTASIINATAYQHVQDTVAQAETLIAQMAKNGVTFLVPTKFHSGAAGGASSGWKTFLWVVGILTGLYFLTKFIPNPKTVINLLPKKGSKTT